MKLTSVKINENLWEEFRIVSFKNKFTFQKLAEKSIHLYLTDAEYRRMLKNHKVIWPPKK